MNPLSHINPVSDAQATHLVSEDALADLSQRIMSTPVPRAAAARKSRARRRWLIGTPVAAGLAAASLIGAMAVQLGPAGSTPALARTLSFTKHGGWTEVTVRDAAADPAAYRGAFRAHGLRATLTMVPASPSAVANLAKRGLSLPFGITATWGKDCTTASHCPVRLKIPTSFRGWTGILLGRPARPGERYELTGPVTGPGEVMHGLHFRGQTVAAVLAMLRQRHATAARFDHKTRNFDSPLPASKVPGTWFVYDAAPWAPQQVQLFVGPTRKVQPGPSPRPAAPTPSSSPSVAPSSSPSVVPSIIPTLVPSP